MQLNFEIYRLIIKIVEFLGINPALSIVLELRKYSSKGLVL